MKTKLKLFARTVLAGVVSLSALTASAQKDPSPTPLGAEKTFSDFSKIQVKNFEDESLGRIRDLGIDLVNGRIVHVLIVTDNSLGLGTKVVAVPPLALIPDLENKVYRLNVSTETFKSAAGIDLSKWTDAGRSERVAAAYKHFDHEPYFLEAGDTASKTAARPKVSLGYVERATKILDLPVGNFQNEKFGKVWSLTLDIPKGRILNVIVLAPGNFQTKSIIPAMALSFNEARNALLLDSTKMEFANEPRFVFTEAAFGQDAHSKEEAYVGPKTSVALEQGSSYRDVDRTIQINKNIRAAKINSRAVQVGTMDGRVTLRGRVNTAEEKAAIGKIAIDASRLELVDNQIKVGKPVSAN